MQTTIFRRLGAAALMIFIASCSGKSGSSSDSSSSSATPAAETATKLVFSNTALSQTGDACGVLTVQPQDATGVQTVLVNAHTLNLTSSDTTGAFYDDSGCATVITTVQLAAGGNSGTVYFKDSAVGAPTVTATDTFATPLTAATQVETITAAATTTTTTVTVQAETATKLVFSNAALTQTTSACGTLTIQSQDASSAQSALTNAHVLNLTSSAATSTFYSDAACASAITTLSLAVGANSATVYFRDSAVGAPTVTATDTFATPLTAATQAETLTASTPAALAFTNPALSQTTAACGTLTLTVEDAAQNAVALVDALSITFSSTSSTGGFFSDADCTKSISSLTAAAATSSVTVYYRDTTVGAPTVTATGSDTTLSVATQAAAITTVSATMVGFQYTDAYSYAYRCISLVVVAEDSTSAAGTFAADVTVNLYTDTDRGAFFASPTCQGSPATTLTMAAGASSTTIYYASDFVGMNVLTLSSVAGSTITSSRSMNLALCAPGQVWSNAYGKCTY